MLHKMKLNENPFERIKNGTKTVICLENYIVMKKK